MYLFENPNNEASVVFDETSISDELKAQGLWIAELPVGEGVLNVDVKTGGVWYTPKPQIVEKIDRLSQLEQTVADLAEIILGGI